MKAQKLVAIVLMVVGAGLVFWGYQMSESLGSQLSKSLTGSFSDEVMWRYIGGVASVLVGGYLFKK